MLSEFGILLLSELEKITDNDEVLRSLFGSTRIILDYDLLAKHRLLIVNFLLLLKSFRWSVKIQTNLKNFGIHGNTFFAYSYT